MASCFYYYYGVLALEYVRECQRLCASVNRARASVPPTSRRRRRCSIVTRDRGRVLWMDTVHTRYRHRTHASCVRDVERRAMRRGGVDTVAMAPNVRPNVRPTEADRPRPRTRPRSTLTPMPHTTLMATPPSTSRASARRGMARHARDGGLGPPPQSRDRDDGDDDEDDGDDDAGARDWYYYYDDEEEEEEEEAARAAAMGAHRGLGYYYYVSPTSGLPSTPKMAQVRARIRDSVGARALIFEIQRGCVWDASGD